MLWSVCECSIKEISFLSDGDTDSITNSPLGTDPGEAIVGAGKERCDIAAVIVLLFSVALTVPIVILLHDSLGL